MPWARPMSLQCHWAQADNKRSLSVPRDKFSIHANIIHLCRMLFPGGRPTSLAHSSLVGERNKTHPWSFSAHEREARPGLNSWAIVAKCHRGLWRILDFMYVFLRQHVCNHNIEKCAPVPGRQLDKLDMIWFWSSSDSPWWNCLKAPSQNRS